MPSSFQGRNSVIRVPSNSRRTRNSPKLVQNKSLTSKDFYEFTRYYEIGNTKAKRDSIFKKQHYTVDDFLFKNRSMPNENKSRPLKSVDSQPLDKDVSKRDIASENVRMDWNNYHRLNVIHNFMEELESEFPSLCTTGIIGKSLEGRDLKIIKISNSDASNACVWIDAGIHAREWIAPAVNTYIANHIARNFDSLPASVRNKDWYFMPVLNPDGYEYTHTNNRMWRKNKAYVRDTLFGVDLNRNFSVGWGGKGSSDEPKHPFYRGPRPFSEPESAAIRDVFMNSGVTFKVYITLHSFGQIIIMPFAYRDGLAPDYIRLLEGATIMSKAIYDTNGNTYKVGISRDVMYPAAGTSNDWTHGAIGIPFCYLIELRSKKHKFRLPKEEIAETGAEILNCVVALMEFIDNYKDVVVESEIKKKPQKKAKDPQPNVNNAAVDVKTSQTIRAEEKEKQITEKSSQVEAEDIIEIEQEDVDECPPNVQETIEEFEPKEQNKVDELELNDADIDAKTSRSTTEESDEDIELELTSNFEKIID